MTFSDGLMTEWGVVLTGMVIACPADHDPVYCNAEELRQRHDGWFCEGLIKRGQKETL